MAKSTLTAVMKLYKVSNVPEWLARQKVLDYPSEDAWSGELFSLPGFQRNAGFSALEVVIECGIQLQKIDRIKYPPLRFVLKALMDYSKMLVFEISESESEPDILIIIDPKSKPKRSVYIGGDAEIWGCDFSDCAFALLASWERNPDRQKAHKARQYLCDAVERLMTKEVSSKKRKHTK